MIDNKEVVKVIKDTTVRLVGEPTFVRIKDLNFKNGSIEIKVLSLLMT
jgi:hypothetical protein